MRRDIKHVKTSRFRKHYQNLPRYVQQLADKSFELLKQNAGHPSLGFKKVNAYWAVRVGINYRTLAFEKGNLLLVLDRKARRIYAVNIIIVGNWYGSLG